MGDLPVKKKILLAVCLFAFVYLLWGKQTVYANNVCVVIDPGHGGGNLGANPEEGIEEKNLTLQVALAMYEELQKYEGIDVYLTRETDLEMSLKERVQFAKKKDADFLFCLHFNMSGNHQAYGAECYVPAAGTLYAKAMDYSLIQMEALTDLGLFDRGIKTRLKKDNKTDYYGIIRNATEENIPAVIIEHCHLDHENDKAFWNESDWLIQYGKIDATCVAKYFGLRSETLQVDYSGYQSAHTEVPENIVYPDRTEPDQMSLELLSIDETTGKATFLVSGYDQDTRMIYYSISFDEGETESERYPWPQGETSFEMSLDIPADQEHQISVLGYNLYDLSTLSNVCNVSYVASKEELNTEALAVNPESDYHTYEEIQIGNMTDPEAIEINEEVDLRIYQIAILILGILMSVSGTVLLTVKILNLCSHSKASKRGYKSGKRKR